MDCNGDGEQNVGEPGVPGVQIHTQEGLSVVTDAAGRYTFGGLSPRTHILNVYETTLPEGTSVSASRVFDAGVGGSRFVSVRSGEIRSEDFAVTGCAEGSTAALRQRIEDFTAQLNAQAVAQDLQFDAPTRQTSVQSSQAVVTEFSRDAEDEIGQDAPRPGLQSFKALATTENLDEVLSASEKQFGFADLAGGEQLIQRAITVRVIGPAGAELSLLHNGEIVDAERIGQRLDNEAGQVVEYVALDLVAGENRFDLVARDGFGNLRGEESIVVTAPGEPARVQIVAPETAIADPATPVEIFLQIVDADGHPAAAPIEATLSARDDAFDVRDTSEQLPGIQTLLNEPSTPISLIPSQTVGTRTISVETQYGYAEARIRFCLLYTSPSPRD